jgi:ElaB/YqjD/DUF883 family membrane-anchored ribosome-binding protein
MANKPTRSSKKDGTNVSGVNRSVVVMGDATGTIQNIHESSIGKTQEEKDELQQLIEQLNSALKSVPSEYTDDAEAVRIKVEDLLTKANTDQPNRKVLQIDADGLKKAAENIASVADNVLLVVTKIIAIIMGSVA